MRAYAVYNDDTFLKLAEDWWDWTWLWTISDAAAANMSASGKSAPLPSECSGYPIIGGTFADTNPTNANVALVPTA
ncbi:hypothetical protein V5O48_014367, partial [Marasmius crinis-equi]